MTVMFVSLFCFLTAWVPKVLQSLQGDLYEIESCQIFDFHSQKIEGIILSGNFGSGHRKGSFKSNPLEIKFLSLRLTENACLFVISL